VRTREVADVGDRLADCGEAAWLRRDWEQPLGRHSNGEEFQKVIGLESTEADVPFSVVFHLLSDAKRKFVMWGTSNSRSKTGVGFSRPTSLVSWMLLPR
jgi:hypothetical protein